MTNTALVQNKISTVEEYLSICRSLPVSDVEGLTKNVVLRGATERYLYLLCQAAIDLAESLIASRQLRKPQTLAESFQILQETGLLPDAVSEPLVRMVGFRNILAHDYRRIDLNILFDVLRTGVHDIENFLRIVKTI